ncbi:hypothetical protein BGX31_007454 [Mortierella sp. GBA43]|nr:hypothetical protein BGX31_007454 [Mortierella sp. GBA43]
MPPHATSVSVLPRLSTSPFQPAKPHILIVGGGIGGLVLAILLERARIPYTVLERSLQIRLLGSAIALGPGVLPLFEQLGMLEEIEQHSKPVTRGMVWSEKLIPIMDLDHSSSQKRYGFLTRVISRPKFYQILLSHVPKEKLQLGKKVVSFTQSLGTNTTTNINPTLSHRPSLSSSSAAPPIVVTCADGSHFTGDIMVGADGAYSITRHLLYQQMEDDYATTAASIGTARAGEEIPSPFAPSSPLPSSDKELLSFTSTCLVGQTRPGLDLSKFKYVRGPDCKIGSIIGDNKPYSWSVFSMPDDSICWMVTEHLGESFTATPSSASGSRSASPSLASSSSGAPATDATGSTGSTGSGGSKSNEAESGYQWGPDKVDRMCDQVKDFPIPCGPGLKMSDLIQCTDRDKISKVMLEEKLFETWSYGRVVLIGDGAVAAIQDAVVLADLLYHLPAAPTIQDISRVFDDFRESRYPMAQQSYETSYQMSHLNEQSWISNFIRRVMNNLPKWIWYRLLDRMYEYRPQVSFLPLVQDRGDIPPLPQSYPFGIDNHLHMHMGIDMSIDP